MENKEDNMDDEKETTDSLDLQSFMNDMDNLEKQTRDSNIKKTTFEYGNLEVTNYLLWLLLGEIMKLNDKLGGE